MGFLTDYSTGKYKKEEDKEGPGTVGTLLDLLQKGLKAVDIGPSEETVAQYIPEAPKTLQQFLTPEQVSKQKELVMAAAEAGLGSGGSLKIGRPIGRLLEKLSGKIPEADVTAKGNQLLSDLLKGGVVTEEQAVANAPKVGEAARRLVKRSMAGGIPEEQAINKMVNLYRNPETAETAADKISRLIREAEPAVAEQEALYTSERAKQAAQLREIQKTAVGEQGYAQQLATLKGELPKAQFKSIKENLTQTDIDGLFKQITGSTALGEFDKITAQRGLQKLLGAEGARLPTEGELKIMAEVFPPQFIESVLSRRPLFQKVFETSLETLSIPRAMMASMDFSAPLRQGIVLAAGNPKQAYYAFKDMFKYAFSENAYKGLMDGIKADPNYPLMRAAKLDVTDPGAFLAQREEAIMSRIPEHIPGVGRLIKGSNRAYTGFLTKLRADVFNSLVADAQQAGINVNRKKFLTNLGEFINTASGRGNLGKLQKLAPALNATFFSPRLIASRIQMLNPQFYTKLDPFVRKQALKSMLSFIGTGSTILTMAKLGGLDVTLNPNSADFGKIKIGNTRLDIWGGFQQYVRFLSNMASGQTVSVTTGITRKVGEGYPQLTRMDMLSSFLTSKEAPVPSFITAMLKGRTATGEEFKPSKEVLARFIPMVGRDMAEAVKEHGAMKGIGLSLPGVFGMGVQTYAPTAEQSVRGTNAVNQTVAKLRKSGKALEAAALIDRNRDLLTAGIPLKPLQTQINKLDRHIKYLEANPEISSKKKKTTLELLNERKKTLEDRRDRLYELRKKKE